MPANEYTSRSNVRHVPPTVDELAVIQAALDAGALSYLVGIGEHGFSAAVYARNSDAQDGALSTSTR